MKSGKGRPASGRPTPEPYAIGASPEVLEHAYSEHCRDCDGEEFSVTCPCGRCVVFACRECGPTFVAIKPDGKPPCWHALAILEGAS